MNKRIGRRTARLAILAALAVLALALWSASTSAQPAQPPYLLYGEGEPGDIVTVYDVEGTEIGMAVVMPNSQWHVNVPCDSEKVLTLSFQVNGEAAAAEVNPTGADQAEISLTTMSDTEMMEESDEMMAEDDSMMSDDEMDSEMMEEDEEMMDEDDAMMDDDKPEDEMMDNGYPESGSGGLADEGPSTGALIGTIAVLLTLVLGLGAYRLRRSRNQA